MIPLKPHNALRRLFRYADHEGFRTNLIFQTAKELIKMRNNQIPAGNQKNTVLGLIHSVA